MIKNKRTGRVLCREEIVCKSFFSLALGLRFRRGSALLCFERPRRVLLDMYFVFHPIDVLFLDDKKRVVEIARLRPWGVYQARCKCCYAVEIPASGALNARIGDVLAF